MTKKKGNGAGYSSAGPINENGATAGHNVAAINAAVQDAAKEVFSLDQQIEAAREKYIKPLQEEKRKAKQRLKADTGLDITDFNVAYAVYRRQEKGKLLDAEEDRGRISDNLRTVFAALEKGEMLDMFDAIGGGYTPANIAAADAEKAAEAAAAKG